MPTNDSLRIEFGPHPGQAIGALVREDSLRRRIDELLAMEERPDSNTDVAAGAEVVQGALSILASLYGSESPQVMQMKQFIADLGRASKPYHPSFQVMHAARYARGALANAKAELDASLIGHLRNQLAGGILGDFLGLARAALDDGTEAGKNVAAVLVAATFEDTLRRIAESKAGLASRPELLQVVRILKDKGILTGSDNSLANSHLQFRNRALHAEWDKVERASIHAVLVFTEQLLVKHFG